jgi:hypothetical protein
VKDNRKTEYCLNCGQGLFQGENYCPSCGQENKIQKVPIGMFLEDLIASILSFDGRFLRTLGPFFFKPGKLTMTFNKGQRKKYTHPIRLYLFSSLFYFFVIGLVIPVNILDDILSKDLSVMGDNEDIGMLEELSPAEKAELDSVLEFGTRNIPFFPSPRSVYRKDSLQKRVTWKELRFLSLDKDISNQEFAAFLSQSSFNLGLPIGIEKKRNFVANSNLFIVQSAKNLPLMMFVLLPFFALLLKLLFYKSKLYYIEHLIHGLHLHALAYVVYGFSILLFLVLGQSNFLPIQYSFYLVSLFAFISIWRVHKQHWFSTLFKFLILGFLYISILIFGVLTELYLSVLLL